ncbi:MAG TPA: tRNA (N(6)-L-threonylcarbamoyladenosine(37)-C(2))-methylthiotransferase MtaB, partial [Candidatus Megaira endosymbiont of Hartmannula sinica]|nr:tRNA (N(6)-L-threonylcarbamoyladenosine(37)-C(2))-methylthiotransferase MtaB [Candidatus Megaera endosymbiont of Hartmannula sinica]
MINNNPCNNTKTDSNIITNQKLITSDKSKYNLQKIVDNKSKQHKKDVITFGCRLNIYESEIIKKHLNEANLSTNVAVFNSCSVTNEAEKQVRQSIRKYKKDNPNSKIIVTGCAAQKDPKLFSSMQEVNYIIGNEEKLHLNSYENIDLKPKVLVNDIMSIKETANHLITGFDGKSRAFIQVQNGCNHRCTFCIIPYGRGNSRSTPLGVIVNQINILSKQGYEEVILTGVDATSYGEDLPGKPTFSQMIRRILNLTDIKRLRLSSIDVAEIDDDLINLIKDDPRLMPHLHISLQAGDDMILKRMKRRHTRTQVIDFCHKIRNIRADIAFGADVIAGFPTETEEMFMNTMELIKETKIEYMHVFPYSSKEGTAASRMPQLPIHIRKNRAKILRDIGENNKINFVKNNFNKIHNVLIEKDYFGHTENFINVKIDNQQYINNQNHSSIIRTKFNEIAYNNKGMFSHVNAPP